MNILVVDDHAIVRQGCVTLLQEVLKDALITEACEGEQAIQLAAEQVFDLVILDTRMPGISGLETARRLLQRRPSTRVLFFSMYEENGVVRQAMELGASGYVCKRSAPAVLIEAVKAVLAGRLFVEHDLSMQLAFGRPNRPDSQADELTAREFEVFTQLASGQSADEVALRLHLSKKTVANYATAIKSKLALRSDAELVHKAIEMGVIEVGKHAVV